MVDGPLSGPDPRAESWWSLVEARRGLLDVLQESELDPQTVADVRIRVEALELIALAQALHLPAAVSGHAELLLHGRALETS